MKRLLFVLLLLVGVSQLHAQAREISADEFFYTLLPKMTKPIVIDFWAEWCGPCHRYTPTFLGVAREYKTKADFYRVNIDQNEEWCTQWRIESIPTTIVVYNKSCEFLRKEGVLENRMLKDMINEGIKNFNSDAEPYF